MGHLHDRFLDLVPIGLATWWFGLRGGAIAIAGCVALYVVGDLVQPVSDFAAAFAVRLVVFIAAMAIAAFCGGASSRSSHSAEELETIRAALTPSAGDRSREAILDWTDRPIRDNLCLLVLRPKRTRLWPPAKR